MRNIMQKKYPPPPPHQKKKKKKKNSQLVNISSPGLYTRNLFQSCALFSHVLTALSLHSIPVLHHDISDAACQNVAITIRITAKLCYNASTFHMKNAHFTTEMSQYFSRMRPWKLLYQRTDAIHSKDKCSSIRPSLSGIPKLFSLIFSKSLSFNGYMSRGVLRAKCFK